MRESIDIKTHFLFVGVFFARIFHVCKMAAAREGKKRRETGAGGARQVVRKDSLQHEKQSVLGETTL
jgi:hypothetical protein